MRISTQSFYQQSQTAMNSQQSSLLRVQQQLGAGTKILAPSDDPIAATRALGVSQSVALNAQYAASRSQANHTLSLEENTLHSVTDVLQYIKTQVVEAGNGTMSDIDRATIATTLQSSFDQLQSLANSDDGNGQFLFSGFKSGSPPFVTQAGGSVQYVGDQGQRLMQVDVTRQMAATDDGHSIFQTVQGGAGYVTASGAANTGSGVFSANSVTNPLDPNYGKDFVISFPAATPGMYLVEDAAAPGVPILTAAYVAGSPITVGGVQINISGAPAAGDTFALKTAKNAGTDMFGALGDIIAALKKPLNTDADRAQLLNALSTGNKKITNAHDNVLTVRSSIGTRMQEIDALNVTGDNRTLFDKSQLSDLQDLDYATAISEFYQRKTALEATQQVFVKIQQISLLKFL